MASRLSGPQAMLSMTSVHHLFASVRAEGRALLATAADPHAELLALVWGPRFDREHARALLAQQPRLLPGAAQSIMAAADSFDRLPPPRQQRLRRIIVRHDQATRNAGRWDNPPYAPHAPHPAD